MPDCKAVRAFLFYLKQGSNQMLIFVFLKNTHHAVVF